MRYKEFLIERVINLHTIEDKIKYAEPVWDMLERSYKKIGGFKSASSVEELANDPGYWKIVRRGDRITAVTIYKKVPKTKNYKLVASATETVFDPESGNYRTTPQGLSDFKMIRTSDIKTKRSWAEVSGAAEHLLLKAGGKPISNEYAEFLTGKKVLELNDDGYHYTRLIQGEPYEKIIVGFVNLSDDAKTELEARGFDLKKLPDNIK